jgi:hypothetical protein
MWHDIFTVGCCVHVAWHIYCRLLCPCGIMSYHLDHQLTVHMSCHMDPTTYSKYIMPHGSNNLQYICHATLTQQPTIHMSCHMDTTTYSKYVMHDICTVGCWVHVAWHMNCKLMVQVVWHIYCRLLYSCGMTIYCRLLCPCGMTYLL